MASSRENQGAPAFAGAGGPPAFAAPAIPELTQQEKTFTLVGALLGLLLAALDQTIVATAGPAIQKDLNIEQSLYTWITTAYLVTSTMMVPIYGKLSDLYGRKPILLIGIGIFLTGSVLCGLSIAPWMIIASRAVQGLGSAALFTSAFAIISDIFPPAVRGRYTGLFGAVFGLSSVIGPLVGGFLTDNISWHWVFYVNLPIGALALAFIISRMPLLKVAQSKPTIDFLGAFWLLITVVPLLLALSLGKTTITPGETGFLWGSWQILGMFAVAAVSLVAFLLTEQRVKDPILDLKLFNIRTFAIGNLAAFVLGAGFLAGIVFLPLFMVIVVGLSATNSGLTIMPLTFGIVAGNIVSGQLVSRIGRYKPLMLVALVLLMIAFVVMGFTLTPTSTQAEVTLKMILVGLGLGPSIPLYTLAIQNAVPPQSIGVATSSATFFRQMGSTIGVAILGTIFATTLSNEIKPRTDVITASLPAAMRDQFSFSGNASGGEGASTQNFDANKIKATATANITKAFDDQQATLTAAIRDNDPAAIKKLLENPQLPDQLKKALQGGGIAASVKAGFAAQYQAIAGVINSGNPQAFQALLANPQLPAALKANLSKIPPQALANPQARAQILAQIKAGLDAAQTGAVTQATQAALDGASKGLETAKTSALQTATETIDKVGTAIKEAFTIAISTVYRIGVLIALLAFLVTAFIPELPLRKTNYAPPAAE
jgi:EmrB/QacA subfamily drug resistance transporter